MTPAKHVGLDPASSNEKLSSRKDRDVRGVLFRPSKKQLLKYQRYAAAQPVKVDPASVKNKRRLRHLKRHEKLNAEAVSRLAASELLLTEPSGFLSADSPGEYTAILKQTEIVDALDAEAASKAVHLELSFGPYSVDVTRNGRYALLGGRKGGMAVLDVNTLQCITEVNVRETVRDVSFLQNYTLWAAAQRKYLHIYDNNGVELHVVRDFQAVEKLEFLPYHLLLAALGDEGVLRYLDVSMGRVVASMRSRRGPCNVMCQNPRNAIISLGHGNGTVSCWTPNSAKPVIDLLAHKGRTSSMAWLPEQGGNCFATAGVDGQWKIWDQRALSRPLNSYFYYGSVPTAMSVSQTGMLALGAGPRVQVWSPNVCGSYKNQGEDAKAAPPSESASSLLDKKRDSAPYLQECYNGNTISSICFRPFEDFCFVGTSAGLETLVVPGSAMANYDSLTADPFESRKVRREREVKTLLEKLPPETITLDPSIIGTLKTEASDNDDEASESDDSATDSD